MVKNLPANARATGDESSTPGSGRSLGEGNGNPRQYSCLENPMDGEAWWATVHGAAKSQTRLSDFTSLHPTSTYSKRSVCLTLICNITENTHGHLTMSESIQILNNNNVHFLFLAKNE